MASSDLDDDPPQTLLLALGELASIQVELLRLLERQARPPQGIAAYVENKLLQYATPPYLQLPENSSPSWQEINALRLRAQSLLKWIAERAAS